jgi:hypothetical protein
VPHNIRGGITVPGPIFRGQKRYLVRSCCTLSYLTLQIVPTRHTRGAWKSLYVAVILVPDYDIYLTLRFYRTKTRFKSGVSTHGARKLVSCSPPGEAWSGGTYGWWQGEGTGDERTRRYESTSIDPVQNDANRSYSFLLDLEHFIMIYLNLFAQLRAQN